MVEHVANAIGEPGKPKVINVPLSAEDSSESESQDVSEARRMSNANSQEGNKSGHESSAADIKQSDDRRHNGSSGQTDGAIAPKRRRVRRRRKVMGVGQGMSGPVGSIDHLTHSADSQHPQLKSDERTTEKRLPQQSTKPLNDFAKNGETPDYKALITEVYRRYNPEKIKDIEDLLRKYSGQEDEVYLLMCNKYGVAPFTHHVSGSSGAVKTGRSTRIAKSTTLFSMDAKEDAELARRFAALQQLRHQLRIQRATSEDADQALWSRFNKLTK